MRDKNGIKRKWRSLSALLRWMWRLLWRIFNTLIISSFIRSAQHSSSLIVSLIRLRFFDSFTLLLNRASSLRELWYFRKKYLSLFEKVAFPLVCSSNLLTYQAIADGPDQPTHAISMISTCAQFSLNANPFYPQEVLCFDVLQRQLIVQRERIGLQSIELAKEMFRKLFARISELIEQIASQRFSWQVVSPSSFHGSLTPKE